jgi:hypothetical protein
VVFFLGVKEFSRENNGDSELSRQYQDCCQDVEDMDVNSAFAIESILGVN